SATNRSPGSIERVSMETPVAANGLPTSLPPVAAAISSEVQSGSAMDQLQRLGGLADVVEGMHGGADDLALLVALAGHHQDVALAQHRSRGADRLAAVADLACALRPRQHLGADRGGLLGAGIVVGDDGH